MPKKPKTNQELVDAFASGIEERAYTTVHSQLGDFVIFKIAGHKAWCGVASPFQYVRIKHMLVRKGDWWMGMETVKREWEGRVKPNDLKEALKRSVQTSRVYTDSLTVPMCEECDEPMHEFEGDERGETVHGYACDGCGWSIDE
jgi:hypothetical protein